MKLDAMSFFNVASQRMKWLGARQQVVSENIANADTPGFKARDTASFEEMVRNKGTYTAVSTTNAAHIGGGLAKDGVRVEQDGTAWEQSLDGNTVVLEQQTIKANEISENYRLAAELYRKGHQLLALAASSK